MPHTIMQLWPGDGDNSGQNAPTLEWVRPTVASTQSAMVVCPGGGYGHLAAHEGVPVAERLAEAGISGFVLRYRHSGGGFQHPIPLRDVSRAIRLIRARASEFAIDPNRVGVLGFSAGGHLAATVSTQFDAGRAGDADPIERFSSRPDVAVLLYPVITLVGPHTHVGSRQNLLGADFSESLHEQMSADRNVTAQTPPTFMFHTVADQAVPVENCLLHAAALRRASVPFEMHLFETGRHGVGLAAGDPVLSVWPSLLVAWLKGQNF